MKRTLRAPLVLLTLLLVASAAVALVARADSADQRANGNPLPLSAAPSGQLQEPDPLIKQRTKGDPAAPITVYEVSDFQCPYCRVFAEEILPQLDREYIAQGKLQIVFVNFPLVQIHANSAAAHELAMCAAQQDRFWPIHDLLFRTQETWSRQAEPAGFFMGLADSATLDRDSLTACIETGAVRWLVEAEATAVARQGVDRTPSFIVERMFIAGAQDMDVWRSVLDSLFAAKTGGD